VTPPSCHCPEDVRASCEPCRRASGEYLAVKDLWLDRLQHEDPSVRTALFDWALLDERGALVAAWDARGRAWVPGPAASSERSRHLWCEITSHCPHQCRHCYFADRLNRGHALLADIETALSESRAWHPDEVVLTGGEPTMHPDFVRILDAATAAAPRVRVLTNGWTRRPAVVAALARPGVHVEIPLFGPEPVHDWMTGTPRSYARVRGTLDLYRGAGVDVTLTTTRTAVTAPHLPYLKAVAADLGIPFVVTELAPLGRAQENWTALAIAETHETPVSA
jgi:MoaA/NifB/PqqE/SkfB family radical SAM enzyme